MRNQNHHVGDYVLSVWRYDQTNQDCQVCEAKEGVIDLSIYPEGDIDQDNPDYQDGEYLYVCESCFEQILADYKERERMAELVFIRYGNYHPQNIADYWLGGAK